MNDSELTSFYRFQAIHYRNLANTYLQQLIASKNKPERHHGKTTLHKDPTGHKAASNVDRERKEKDS